MKTIILGFLIPLTFLLSSCAVSGNVEAQQEEWKKEMFNRHYYTDDQQVTVILEEMIEIIETQDHAAMKALFANSVVAVAGDLKSDVVALFDAYKGEMVSFQLYGPVTSGSKNGGKYTKIIDAIYDVTTTEGVFRIAFRVYTIDSHTSDNLGIHSLYLVKTEDSTIKIDDWNTGINIESSLLHK